MLIIYTSSKWQFSTTGISVYSDVFYRLSHSAVCSQYLKICTYQNLLFFSLSRRHMAAVMLVSAAD